MPYCPECGIHYLQPNSTCVSCGRDLSTVFNSPDPKIETFGKSTSPLPSSNEPVTEFGGFRPQVESHLGKGLVKPQSVEVGMDGFHFRYDQPPNKFVKSEALKDKIVEFRVTAPMDPPEQLFEKEQAAPNTLPEPSFIEASAPLELEEPIHQEEPVLETPSSELTKLEEPGESAEPDEPETLVEPMTVDAQIAEPVNPVGPEISVVPEAPTPPEIKPGSEYEAPETEPLITGEEYGTGETEAEQTSADNDEGFGVPVDEVAPEFPEPELKQLEEPESLWEGKGSWYGFSAGTQYRITNQSVVIVEPYSYRFTEFELPLISNVKLRRTWLMKLLGIGDLTLAVNGLPEPGLVLKGIREPEKVKRLLEELLA